MDQDNFEWEVSYSSRQPSDEKIHAQNHATSEFSGTALRQSSGPHRWRIFAHCHNNKWALETTSLSQPFESALMLPPSCSRRQTNLFQTSSDAPGARPQ